MSVSPAQLTRRGSLRQEQGSPRRGIDGLTVLTIYLVLLSALPSSLTITALGEAGRPSTLWALGATLWWCWYQLQRQAPAGSGPQPVRMAMFAFLAVGLVSYAGAMLRGLPTDEISPADNGILRLLAWGGILLVASDGLSDAAELRRLLHSIAWAGALLAGLGILQFVTGNTLIDWISLPGMSSNSSFEGLETRAGFIRASATAIHPLEYAVVLSAAFPIAIVLATERGPGHLWRLFAVALIATASILSLSRSAVVGIAVGVIVLLPALSRGARAWLVTATAVLVVAVGVLVPGMIGTLRGLFSGIVSDPSTLSRTNSYETAAELVGRFPLVGKGFGTLLARYHIFDNQFLLLSIELGVLGLVAFLILVVTALISAIRAQAMATSPLDRQLSRSLAAAAAASTVLMAFFDGFSFPMSAGILFLTLGLCAAAKRLFPRAELQSSSIR